MKIKGKVIAKFFYDELLGTKDVYQCKKCDRHLKSPKGYTNLFSHLRSCIGHDYEARLLEHLKINKLSIGKDGNIIGDLKQRDLTSFIHISDKESRAFTWIRWIASRNMPISEIENWITRDLAKSHKPFSSKTLRKYIIATAQCVEEEIKDELKDAGPVTLLMDGWTADGTSTHYIAIFAGYLDAKNDEYKEVLLAIQPTLEEEDLGADAHIDLFNSTLELYT
jgi:hypothetical protein